MLGWERLSMVSWLVVGTLGGCTDDGQPKSSNGLERDTGALVGDGADTDPDGSSGDGSDEIVYEEHCGRITADETWGPPGTVHQVTCDVKVDQGTLTLAEGVTVEFLEGLGLEIGGEDAPASLVALGTPEAPVTLRTVEAGTGKWKGLFLLGNTLAAELHNLVVLNGGTATKGGVYAKAGELTVDGLHIEGAESCGLRLEDEAQLMAGARGLRLTGNGLPACAHVDLAHALPTEDSDYTGNFDDRVRVWREDLAVATTWEDLGVPYWIEDTIKLGGTAVDPAILTIGPSTVLLFAENKGIVVGAGGGGAGLMVQGTETSRVVFGAAEAERRGAWGQVEVVEGVLPDALQLDYLTMENGGGKGAAMLEFGMATLRFTDLRLQSCQGAGLGGRYRGRIDSPGQTILVQECDQSIFVAAHTLTDLSELTLNIQDNSLDGIPDDSIHVVARNAEQAVVSEPGVWRNFGLPYIVEESILLRGSAALPADVRIDAGTQLRFSSGKALLVGTGAGEAALILDEAADNPVYFGPADASIAGAWKGLRLGELASAERTVLDGFTLEYAGGGVPGALWIQDLDLTVRNATIRHTDPDACAVNVDRADPAGIDVVIEDSVGGGICSDD